ncbi:hypothetical protein C8A05DRAFT_38635 [Staphylotrichum tortipilum]|uniref:Uncharacterized protein n=1 Tax=Staphylotrichum tortipilum TaxID=2831512 RepID=A0AAN6MD61_9PEZI|nr:hypothetical protein C8A05DRAFT_38635 [Staphylotrichum longicolle]
MEAILPATTSFYLGCCRDGGGGCDVPEACVAATAPAVPGAPTHSATLTCSGAQPSCVTYTWAKLHMISFGCGTAGGIKTADLEPAPSTRTTTRFSTSSFATSMAPPSSTTNPPAATDTSNGNVSPGLGVMYGEFFGGEKERGECL